MDGQLSLKEQLMKHWLSIEDQAGRKGSLCCSSCCPNLAPVVRRTAAVLQKVIVKRSYRTGPQRSVISSKVISWELCLLDKQTFKGGISIPKE